MSRMVALAMLSGCAGGSEDADTGAGGAPEMDAAERAALASIEGSWECENSPEYFEFLDLDLGTGADPRSLRVELLRQVGSEDDPELPYETVCRYAQHCTRFSVDANARGDLPWMLEYTVDRFELLPDPDNSQQCDVFIERHNALIESQEVSYHLWFAEPDDDGAFLTDDWTCRRRAG